VLEAEALIALRQGRVIEKDRYIIPHLDKMWEVDVFAGENARLVIAEIELRDENERVVLPPWEVTGPHSSAVCGLRRFIDQEDA
jgi:adenylate cyclase